MIPSFGFVYNLFIICFVFKKIIKQGVLNRTKLIEGGKRIRKNWSNCYIALTDFYLLFFKDAKSAQSVRNKILINFVFNVLFLLGIKTRIHNRIGRRCNYVVSRKVKSKELFSSQYNNWTSSFTARRMCSRL
jgi:hypothetical protein